MIRAATEEDFDEILNMSELFWLDTQFDEPFERDHTWHMVNLAFEHGLLAVVEIDSRCVGFCAGVKSPILGSSKALGATEVGWYVYPEHRKGKNGIALLQFMEGLVQEQGIKYWTMVSMQSSMPEEVGRMYERLGYVHSETCYTKVFHYGSSNGGASGCRRRALRSQKAS